VPPHADRSDDDGRRRITDASAREHLSQPVDYVLRLTTKIALSEGKTRAADARSA